MTIPTLDTSWFRARLADAGITQREFAGLLGISPSGVSRMFKGERRMQIGEAKAFAKATGVRLEEVLEHAGRIAE